MRERPRAAPQPRPRPVPASGTISAYRSPNFLTCSLRLTEQFILLDARVLLGNAAALGPKMTALEKETSEQFESELAVNVDALGKKVAGRSIQEGMARYEDLAR